MRTDPRSGFRSGGTSACTLVPVFVPGDIRPNHPFGNHGVGQPPNLDPEVLHLDDPARADRFADSHESADSRESSQGYRTEPLFFHESRFGAQKHANHRLEAIRANRSNVMKIGVFLQIDSCKWTQRAQGLKKFKISLQDWNFQSTNLRLKFSSEIENFKRATQQGLLSRSGLKISSELETFNRAWNFQAWIENFKRMDWTFHAINRDWNFSIAGPSGN